MINKELVLRVLASDDCFLTHQDRMYWLADRMEIEVIDDKAEIRCYAGHMLVNTIKTHTDILNHDVLKLSGIVIFGDMDITAA